MPNVVLQVQKNIERKVDIIVATLKEGKRGRAFVGGWPETFGWDCSYWNYSPEITKIKTSEIRQPRFDVSKFRDSKTCGKLRSRNKSRPNWIELWTTFQSSYFNRDVKFWNCACNVVNISTFSNPDNFQIFLKDNYFNLLNSIFDTDLICTWSSVRDCPCHKS